jgi:thiol-disulfide isomerase/thioredoxin
MKKQTWTRRQIGLAAAVLLVILGSIWWVSRSELEKNGLEENLFISGQIRGAGGLQLFLEAPSDRGVISVAQTEIAEDGSFELPANVPGLGIYNLRISDLNGSTLWLPLQPNDKLSLNCTLQDYSAQPGIKGVSWASTFAKLMKATNIFETTQQSLQQNPEGLTQDQINAGYQNAKAAYEQFCSTAILQDLSSPLNILLSMNLLPTTGFEDWNAAHLQTLEKLSQAYAKHYAGQKPSENMQAQYAQIEDAFFAYTQMTNGSMAAPEITLPDPAGKTRSLSSLKGKYVLIDFWASWCGPCKSEMPNVIAAYNKYKNKGFTIFSVSLDENKNEWQKGIKTFGMPWPDQVNEQLGWKSQLPQLYQFDGIPYTVLLNPEGKIIGTNLRGQKLQDKLAQIFK